MKLLIVAVLVLLVSCRPPKLPTSNQPLEIIEQELSGDLLGKQFRYPTKKIENEENEIVIFMKHLKLSTTEIDIYFNKNSSERFVQIQEFYNSRFHTNQKDSLYGSWQTDSTEFILFKNSDSSILVNIFKRN